MVTQVSWSLKYSVPRLKRSKAESLPCASSFSRLRMTVLGSMRCLELDARAQLHDPVGRDPEKSRGAGGVARHDREELLPPQGHAGPNLRDQRLPAEEKRSLHHLELHALVVGELQRARHVGIVLEAIVRHHA